MPSMICGPPHAHRVLDVQLEGDADARLLVETRVAGDTLEHAAPEVAFHQQQHDVALPLQGQPHEGAGRVQTLATGRGDHGAAGGAGAARGLDDALGLLVRDHGDDELELHGAASGLRRLARRAVARAAFHALACA
jgi:hypothetical protein